MLHSETWGSIPQVLITELESVSFVAGTSRLVSRFSIIREFKSGAEETKSVLNVRFAPLLLVYNLDVMYSIRTTSDEYPSILTACGSDSDLYPEWQPPRRFHSNKARAAHDRVPYTVSTLQNISCSYSSSSRFMVVKEY